MIMFLVGAVFLLQGFAYGVTPLKDQDCRQLAVETSIVAFSFDTNGLLFQPHNLNKSRGAEYINSTRHALNVIMEQACAKDNGISLEEFKSTYHAQCSSTCQSKQVEKRMPEIAGAVCLSICNKTYKQLETLEKGVSIGKQSLSTTDCSSLNDSGRNTTKEIIENVKGQHANDRAVSGQ